MPNARDLANVRTARPANAGETKAPNWKPGQSGNPGGRPKTVAHVRELARQHTDAAMRRIVQIMREGPPSVALAAAQTILAYGHGKPAQMVEVGGLGGGPVRIDAPSLLTEIIRAVIVEHGPEGPIAVHSDIHEFSAAVALPPPDENGVYWPAGDEDMKALWQQPD